MSESLHTFLMLKMLSYIPIIESEWSTVYPKKKTDKEKKNSFKLGRWDTCIQNYIHTYIEMDLTLSIVHMDEVEFRHGCIHI